MLQRSAKERRRSNQRRKMMDTAVDNHCERIEKDFPAEMFLRTNEY
jgi:hypothetical protein